MGIQLTLAAILYLQVMVHLHACVKMLCISDQVLIFPSSSVWDILMTHSANGISAIYLSYLKLAVSLIWKCLVNKRAPIIQTIPKSSRTSPIRSKRLNSCMITEIHLRSWRIFRDILATNIKYKTSSSVYKTFWKFDTRCEDLLWGTSLPIERWMIKMKSFKLNKSWDSFLKHHRESNRSWNEEGKSPSKGSLKYKTSSKRTSKSLGLAWRKSL